MAIAFVQSKGVHVTTGAASVTLTSTPTVGNLLVAVRGVNTNTSSVWSTPLSPLALLTSRGSGQSTACGIDIRQVQAGDGSTYAWTPSAGSSYDLIVAEFSGFTAPTADGTTGADSGSTSVTTQNSGTLSAMVNAGDLELVAAFSSSALGSPSFDSGFTTLTPHTSARLCLGYQVAPSQTGQNTTLTVSSAIKLCLALGAVTTDVLSTAGFTGWGQPL